MRWSLIYLLIHHNVFQIDAFYSLSLGNHCCDYSKRIFHFRGIYKSNPKSYIQHADRNPIDTTIQVQMRNENEQNGGIYIRFSRAFQRYVVFKCSSKDTPGFHDDFNSGEIIKSYMFLDDALESYPHANFVKLRDIIINDEHDEIQFALGGMGTVSLNKMIDMKNSGMKIDKTFEYFKSLSSIGYRKQVSNSIYTISPKRFALHTTESIHRSYDRVMDLLTRGRNRNVKSNNNEAARNILFNITKVGLGFQEADARAVIAEFPQLCLYDIHEIEDRIKFMISPFSQLNQAASNTDFYCMLRSGFGAGLTVEQATKAVAAIPQLLSVHYEDSRKPSMIYFYKFLNLSPQSINEARSELSQYMLGCDGSDVCSFAYLHSLGIRWNQILLLLDSFPTLTYSEKDPSWDLLDGHMRSQLGVDMLIYLRKRLQISNDDIHSMLMVHSRLSCYGVQKVKETLDALQYRLHLSSSELRRLVLRMPSIIGMNVDNTDGDSTLDKKISFFLNEVRLDPDQIKECIMRHPSLLQYSLPSLSSKLTFLTNEVGIPTESLERVITHAPVILGLSLEENLMPTVSTIKSRCELSSQELGEIITTCPTILTLSLKRKIDPCLNFLTKKLLLSSPTELGHLIKSTPRVLLQGIESSLACKISMIQDAIKKESEGQTNINIVLESVKIVRGNPSLLVTTNSILRKRITQCLSDSKKTIAVEFARRATGRKKMFFDTTNQLNPTPAIEWETYETKHKMEFDKNCLFITAYVSGMTYPPDNINKPRGKRRSGGIAILFSNLNDFNFDFDLATNNSFGMTMPNEDGKLSRNIASVQVGFPFLRPSRNRCNLYACHGALKVVLQLLKQVATLELERNTNISVKIYTDSSYAWKLLSNSTKIIHWGSFSSADEFVFDGVGPISMSNPDLLYPLARTAKRIIEKETFGQFGKDNNIDGVNIEILHSSDDEKCYQYIKEVNMLAVKAAKWQFDKG